MVFLAEDILYRNHNVLQVNERRAAAADTRVVHLLSCDSRHLHIEDENSDTFSTWRTGSSSTESVCSQLPLRDPLLLSVNNPAFAILGLFRRGGQTSHIRAGYS